MAKRNDLSDSGGPEMEIVPGIWKNQPRSPPLIRRNCLGQAARGWAGRGRQRSDVKYDTT
ncbi:unnamed protein product [Fusarium graminearum]|nr:unnamed protein product [Fusarium graminearum]